MVKKRKLILALTISVFAFLAFYLLSSQPIVLTGSCDLHDAIGNRISVNQGEVATVGKIRIGVVATKGDLVRISLKTDSKAEGENFNLALCESRRADGYRIQVLAITERRWLLFPKPGSSTGSVSLFVTGE